MDNNKFDEFVQVSVRIKPDQSLSDSSCVRLISEQPPILLLSEKSQTYHFDNIFTDEVDQETIYKSTVRPLVEHVKAGYNCTVFAYGQTGTGKTYTMGTSPDVYDEDAGLISRTLKDFFSSVDLDIKTEIYVSFIEIYNEKVFDLLNDNRDPLPVKGFRVHGFNKEKIYSMYDGLSFLKMGGKNRHTGETKQNMNSSRSHAIFTIYCGVNNDSTETIGKLNLVDLAGSENVRKTGNQGSSFQEGININKGLLCLGRVMMALSKNLTHIPYRQSIITTILQDSLNEKNFISLIACISSNPRDSGETSQTLEFAYRVKKMRNKPEVNQIIFQYKKDNPVLFPNPSTRFQTPMKRSHLSNICETPSKKPHSFISEPLNSFDTTSQKSLCSMSISSLQNEAVQSNLSPIIKKYMNAMENSLMARLEDVIKNTVERPSRKSTKSDKENCSTPNLPWDKIQNKVANMVRTEIIQFTSQASRATSSPIETDGFHEERNSERELIPRKLFNEDNSPIVSSDNIPTAEEKDASIIVNISTESKKEPEFADDVIFKVPQPKLKAKPSKRRTSARLQLKALSTPVPTEAKQTRRSVRLSLKNKPSEINCVKTPTVKNFKKQSQESPITVHTKDVLRILNEGILKDLQKLHGVGQKTAEMIMFFRKLKGAFKQVSDLSEMPQWQGNKYQKFLTQNFLKS